MWLWMCMCWNRERDSDEWCMNGYNGIISGYYFSLIHSYTSHFDFNALCGTSFRFSVTSYILVSRRSLCTKHCEWPKRNWLQHIYIYTNKIQGKVNSLWRNTNYMSRLTIKYKLINFSSDSLPAPHSIYCTLPQNTACFVASTPFARILTTQCGCSFFREHY